VRWGEGVYQGGIDSYVWSYQTEAAHCLRPEQGPSSIVSSGHVVLGSRSVTPTRVFLTTQPPTIISITALELKRRSYYSYDSGKTITVTLQSTKNMASLEVTPENDRASEACCEKGGKRRRMNEEGKNGRPNHGLAS
ncbi:hypothetical protein V5O48_011971, partial [Marasmius crinis-equi]